MKNIYKSNQKSRKNGVKKIVLSAIVLAGVCLSVIISCGKTEKPTDEILYCGERITTTFLAGQHYEAGMILVGNDKQFLYVTYNASNGWVMKKTHLYAGGETGFPKNAAPEQFPFKTTHGSGVTTYTYTIPLSILSNNMVISAHAEVEQMDADGKVIQSQTAWGSGVSCGDNGDSWAMKFNYWRQRCPGDIGPGTIDPDEICYGENETGWGAGDRYNSNDSNNLATYTAYVPNTPITIYAGKQQHEVGTLNFIEVDNATVKIVIYLVGWGLQNVSEPVKIQGYNGSVPKGNPSPGQFKTYKGTSLTITVPKYAYYGIHLNLRRIIPCE